MTISVAALAAKQQPAKPRDLQDCGWMQTQFPESFGSGGILGPEIGLDGHLWITIPIGEVAAAMVAKGAGLHRSIHEILPNADPNGWRLRASFYKYSRGFFSTSVWIGAIHLGNVREQIFIGFIAATRVRQFATDLRQMIEIGIPTFPSAPHAYEAVP